MFHFNVDLAINCLKSISVNTQCVTCDKLVGLCVRFPCGHSVCEGCAQRIGECLLCSSSPASYLIDKPQTVRLNNTAALLTAFQDTFKIDVYKRQRISDHLKTEKLIFPKCIQAPHKYSNKRKSFNSSFKNKENISPNFFSGEKTQSSNIVIMKKSAQYVQNWLNQHESTPQNLPRRPFRDINTQSLVEKSKRDVLKHKNVIAQTNVKKSMSRVKSHLKTIRKSPSLLNNTVSTNLETKSLSRHLKIKEDNFDYQVDCRNDKNESGIVLDDEPIVIEEDIDASIIDKDEQAWLAVLKAAERDECEDKEREKNNLHDGRHDLLNMDGMANSTLIEKRQSKIPKNVLFLKKSTLLETCKLCNNYFKTKSNCSSKVNRTNDVSIVINNSSFITTIKFTNCEDKKCIIDQTSMAVQTDENTMVLTNKMTNVVGNVSPQKRKSILEPEDVQKKMLKPNDISQSLDVFTTEKDLKQDLSDDILKRHKGLVIEDSDTDSNMSCDNTHEVTVDVHRSNVPDDFGILRTLSKVEYEHKTNRQRRGPTPNSSNSSDKENFDPNRKKKMKLEKKRKHKK